MTGLAAGKQEVWLKEKQRLAERAARHEATAAARLELRTGVGQIKPE